MYFRGITVGSLCVNSYPQVLQVVAHTGTSASVFENGNRVDAKRLNFIGMRKKIAFLD